MTRVSFIGVLVGGIADVLGSIVLGLPFAVYTVSRLDLSNTPRDQVGAAVTAAIHENVPLYVAQLLVGPACSFMGGFVAAWLAKRHELLNGGLSSIFCVALGVYGVSTGKDSNPHWLQALFFVAGPLLAVLGGDLMRRLRRSRLQLQSGSVHAATKLKSVERV